MSCVNLGGRYPESFGGRVRLIGRPASLPWVQATETCSDELRYEKHCLLSLFCSLLMLAGHRHEELLCQEDQKAGWLQECQEQDRIPLGPHGPSDLASAACHPFIHACAHTSWEITPAGLTWGCSPPPPGGGQQWSCLGRPPEPLWSGGGQSPWGRESGQESSTRWHSKWPCPSGAWGLPVLISSHPHHALEGGSTNRFHFIGEDPEVVVSPGLGPCSQASRMLLAPVPDCKSWWCWVRFGQPGDFPGGPVVKTPSLHCKGHRFIPGQGTKIPYATQCGRKKKRFG